MPPLTLPCPPASRAQTTTTTPPPLQAMRIGVQLANLGGGVGCKAAPSRCTERDKPMSLMPKRAPLETEELSKTAEIRGPKYEDPCARR